MYTYSKLVVLWSICVTFISLLPWARSSNSNIHWSSSNSFTSSSSYIYISIVAFFYDVSTAALTWVSWVDLSICSHPFFLTLCPCTPYAFLSLHFCLLLGSLYSLLMFAHIISRKGFFDELSGAVVGSALWRWSVGKIFCCCSPLESPSYQQNLKFF